MISHFTLDIIHHTMQGFRLMARRKTGILLQRRLRLQVAKRHQSSSRGAISLIYYGVEEEGHILTRWLSSGSGWKAVGRYSRRMRLSECTSPRKSAIWWR